MTWIPKNTTCFIIVHMVYILQLQTIIKLQFTKILYICFCRDKLWATVDMITPCAPLLVGCDWFWSWQSEIRWRISRTVWFGSEGSTAPFQMECPCHGSGESTRSLTFYLCIYLILHRLKEKSTQNTFCS